MTISRRTLSLTLSLALSATALTAMAQTLPMPKVSGTLRTKMEVQTERSESRFEVRNARVALDGKITDAIGYKAEIDLSDEGKIKMLDAWASYTLLPDLRLTMGQMRVPFTIDAHRSPHVQMFANRSFIAKQVGNVRDVGLAGRYMPAGTGLTLEAGAFNGSGLTDQKDYWTRSLNFSAKVQWKPVQGLTLQGSVQKLSPKAGPVYLYDGGFTLTAGRLMLEGEYLRKHYAGASFQDVNAVDAFAAWTFPLRGGTWRQLLVLARYDAMGDHSDGTPTDDGAFKRTDAARQRLTGGLTLRFAGKLPAELRLNYEKYFYRDETAAKPSELDKAVVELMIHF